MAAVTRGCGDRVQGAIYATCPLSPNGRPLEEFIVDPPRLFDPAALGVTPVGVKLFEQGGVTHILDWVGSQHYRNVADFVEEVRHLGASRRLPRNLDFSRLTSESRLVLIHARAHIAHPETFYAMLPELYCPKRLLEHRGLHPWTDPVPAHPKIPECCAWLWWEDIEPEANDSFDTNGGRSVVRMMPSFRYEARMTPQVLDPDRFPAVFMRLPIACLEVVRADNGSHEAAQHAAEQAQLPVELEDE